MVKVEQIDNFKVIKVSENQGVYGLDLNHNIVRVIDRKKLVFNVYNFQLSQDEILFTNKELGDLKFASRTGEIKLNLPGFFYLSFFHDIGSHYAVVKNHSPNDFQNSVVLIDKKTEKISAFKPFRLYHKERFITTTRNEIISFDKKLSIEEKVLLSEVFKNLDIIPNISRDFLAKINDYIITTVDNGSVFGIHSSNDNYWILKRAGRLTAFDNLIYSVSDQTLREIDAQTGEILKSQSIKNLELEYCFFPTGEHKVYNDFIFIMAAGKPGRVAIYNRKNLEFKNMIELEELIPFGKDYLHWHKERLYILDFRNTIHVYENALT